MRIFLKVQPEFTVQSTIRNNSYYFSRANQQKGGIKIYSLTQCSLTVNECDWHILAGNDERINSHCLTRTKIGFSGTTIIKLFMDQSEVSALSAGYIMSSNWNTKIA